MARRVTRAHNRELSGFPVGQIVGGWIASVRPTRSSSRSSRSGFANHGETRHVARGSRGLTPVGVQRACRGHPHRRRDPGAARCDAQRDHGHDRPDGQPHLVAMWFALVDGDICFETKAKSQKAVNLRRDARISCLVETGPPTSTSAGRDRRLRRDHRRPGPALADRRQHLGAVLRSVHRRPRADRRDHAQQADRRTCASASLAFLGFTASSGFPRPESPQVTTVTAPGRRAK